ncbi:uncharacterized protein [Diadema antillarum]|uniref:uncharacterized protein n=1 Tax=Diadema antillarum TaxID=105358 RepID=UPI003A835C6D
MAHFHIQEQCLILSLLPFSVTLLLIAAVGCFVLYQYIHDPASVSRAVAHVQLAAATATRKFRQLVPEETGNANGESAADFSSISRRSPQPRAQRPRETGASQNLIDRGKENIRIFVRPGLQRRFGNIHENDTLLGHRNLASPHRQQKRIPPSSPPSTIQHLHTTARSPAPNMMNRSWREGANFSTGYRFDEKLSFSKLPLSPIFPPNKSVNNSPDQEPSPTMMRFNSGQDSLLHPSMHYPTHQPDLVTSPGVFPSVSWLGGNNLASPRQRKGLPRVQNPVMVKIASPLPNRPASPLFRKLAAEGEKQKSSSTDKVLMAIRSRQKRPVQEVNADGPTSIASFNIRSESKRRKLNGPSAEEKSPWNDIDMDLDHNPVRSASKGEQKCGILSPTPRNAIESSVSSTKRTEGMLKRRSESVEVEEEDGVSPIKKRALSQQPRQVLSTQSPSQSDERGPDKAGMSSSQIPVRAGSKGLLLERKSAPSSEADAAKGTTPKRKMLFTPKKVSRVQRVDTPGEYTAADKDEDRAHARRRFNYLKEMLIEEPETPASQGISAPTPTATPSLLTSTTIGALSTPSATPPTFSLGLAMAATTAAATAKSTAASVSAPPTIATTEASVLSALSSLAKTTSTNPLLSASDREKLSATSSEKSLGSGKATQFTISASASATVPGTTTQPKEKTNGFQIPTASIAGAPTTSQAPASFSFQGIGKATTSSPGSVLGMTPGNASVPPGGQSAVAGNTNTDSNAKTPLSLGFQVQGLATTVATSTSAVPPSTAFGLGNQAAANTSSSAATTSNFAFTATTSTSKPQFKPIFGAPSNAATSQAGNVQTSATKAAPQATGVFQFGQSSSSAASTPSRGIQFGNTPAQGLGMGTSTASFQSTASTATTIASSNKPMFSMPSASTSAPSAPGSSFTPIFGKPSGTPANQSSQTKAGGFTFTPAATSTSSAIPGTFSFGGSNAAPTSTSTVNQSSSAFGTNLQNPPSFGVGKAGVSSTASVFGATPIASTQAKATESNAASTGSIFGGTSSQQNSLFGSSNPASTGGTTSVFGAPTTQQGPPFGGGSISSGTPGTPGSMFGGTSTTKPAFGNPIATVTPFGSGASQPSKPAAAVPTFQFGSTQPAAAPQQPSQPPLSGGFNFSGTKPPQPSFNFGSPAAPSSSSFQFGQTPSQPAGANSQQNFFSGASGGASGQFGFGSPAATPGAGTATPTAFGVSPSPAGSSGAPGGGFSIGTAGSSQASNQRRANRLRQLRSKTGRR